MKVFWFVFLLIFISIGFAAQSKSKKEVFDHFNPGGKLVFSAENGDKMWHTNHTAKDGKQRSCTTCHGKDLTKAGKHKKTGKKIDPMSLKVNKERLTDIKKIEKWFKRNCKWTLGRECTPQEKGDFLEFLYRS